nr:uncharacterized protein LOC123494658 [Aegilops tauschii subsp. strangulata]
MPWLFSGVLLSSPSIMLRFIVCACVGEGSPACARVQNDCVGEAARVVPSVLPRFCLQLGLCVKWSLLLRVAGVDVPPEATLSSTRRSSPATGEKCTALGCSPSRGQVVSRCGAAQKHVPDGSVLWLGWRRVLLRVNAIVPPSAECSIHLTALQSVFLVHAARNPPMCRLAKILQCTCP